MTIAPITDTETAAALQMVRRNGRQYKSGFGGVCAICRKPVAAASVEVLPVDRESREIVAPVAWNDPRYASIDHMVIGRDCKRRMA